MARVKSTSSNTRRASIKRAAAIRQVRKKELAPSALPGPRKITPSRKTTVAGSAPLGSGGSTAARAARTVIMARCAREIAVTLAACFREVAATSDRKRQRTGEAMNVVELDVSRTCRFALAPECGSLIDLEKAFAGAPLVHRRAPHLACRPSNGEENGPAGASPPCRWT